MIAATFLTNSVRRMAGGACKLFLYAICFSCTDATIEIFIVNANVKCCDNIYTIQRAFVISSFWEKIISRVPILCAVLWIWKTHFAIRFFFVRVLLLVCSVLALHCRMSFRVGAIQAILHHSPLLNIFCWHRILCFFFFIGRWAKYCHSLFADCC